MFLNFLEQMVHSTGLSPRVIVVEQAVNFSATGGILLVMQCENRGVVVMELLLLLDSGTVGRVKEVDGMAVKLWLAGIETSFPLRDSFSSCSISCSC